MQKNESGPFHSGKKSTGKMAIYFLLVKRQIYTI